MPYYHADGRHVIVGVLANLHANNAAPALLRILREEGEGKSYMGEVIIPALADLNYQPAVPELRAIRAEAARAANRPAESRPFTPWVDPHDIARDARLAAYALIQLGDRSVIPALLLEYRDHLQPDKPNKMDNADFRREIVQKLSQLAIYDDIPLMAQFLDDPHPNVQYEATRALTRLTGTGEKNSAENWRDWWKSHAKDFPHLPTTLLQLQAFPLGRSPLCPLIL